MPQAVGRAIVFYLFNLIKVGLILVVLGLVVACANSSSSSGFVGRDGTSFVLDGKPFRFIGTNMYDAAGDPDIYECGPQMKNPDEELDDWFERFKRDSGSRVIRFWAYQSYTKGGTDWHSFDRVMYLANKHDLKVIPVLENQWQDCTEGGYKQDAWYAGGYLERYGAYTLSYKEYVNRVIERYKNEPAIAAWMLMNEAESKTTDGSANPEALYTFTRDMSNLIKSIDQNHLVTLGTTGGGQPGISGENYEKLHSLSSIDFVDFHDYGADDMALPGRTGETNNADTLSAAMDIAKKLNKPILVGEAGMTACGSYEDSQPETVQSRAQKFDAKINAFFKNGGAGYLLWVWDPSSDCSYNFTTDDPLNTVLARNNLKLWIEDFLRGMV